MHEAVHFVSRDENVPEELAKEPSRGVAKLRRNRDDRTPHANDSRELPDEVERAIAIQIGYMDRLMAGEELGFVPTYGRPPNA